MTLLNLVLLALFLYILLRLLKYIFAARPSHRSIPGPRGWPVLGNARQLTRQPHRQIQQWAAQYGELFQVKLGWETWVFVTTPEAVREIFDRQSAKTSGRAPMPVLSDLLSGGNRLLLLTYGQRWRQLRTVVHKLLTPKASATYKPSQEFEAKQLIYDIATGNEDQQSFYQHVRRYTTSVVLTSTYGKRVPSWNCDDTREIYQLLQDFSEAGEPGAFLADLFPPLAKLPVRFQWWRSNALGAYERQKTTWMRYWNDLKAASKEKRAPECFVKQFLETDFEKLGIDDVQAGFVAGSVIEAGSETTSSALNSCILHLAAYPSVQHVANAELTSVVGDERSPSFSDEEHLPYIRAMGKEILRIRPVTTIGSPHYTTSDYLLHFDSAKWDHPEVFDPSRYLAYPEKAGVYAAQGDPDARDHYDFGAGRRVCPGMHLAENSLFITIAKIVWAFEIRPPLGADGNEVPVDVSDAAYEPGVNTLPKPFKVRFIPRSQKRLEVLRAEWAQAQADGFSLGGAKVEHPRDGGRMT
ncbi:Cytochrome P450 monooxygenase patI [Colletotrichum sidae]|uniref:Cytochrome P450 monooxygenase patI n=1 Tax=Colletotrichum sidae TaxID=1347389 RepID=A0A4R8T0R2_9PEZI|nr:Cytochrome P450 monooxygenase patI [Colletotrichum sidae]